MMKLNLGCGSKILEGYTNVDKFDYYNPDIVHDLEKTPYPFDENSISEIVLSHVLEHLGQDPEVFNEIIKELYRICKNNSIIDIRIPHPRHDDFISDPTHVRPITIMTLELYDKELNNIWVKNKNANSTLAHFYNVNFKITDVKYIPTVKYKKIIDEKKISEEDLIDHISKYNNVIKEIYVKWKVIKN